MPFRAYISFSQYSASSARLTRTRPNRRQSPRPKSVTSQRGLGGSAQPCSRKQAWAELTSSLMALRFMGFCFVIDELIVQEDSALFRVRAERRVKETMTLHRLLRRHAAKP